MGSLASKTRELRGHAARSRNGRDEAALALASRLRHMWIIGLVVLTADWASKAMILQFSPSSVTNHYTHPNPLALLLVLACAPIVLRVARSRWMVVALGVCIGGCAGNLLQHAAGMPVTDFIPLPQLLANPQCSVHYSCTVMCNVADLALWSTVPLLALAFAHHVITHVRKAPTHGATV